MADYVTRTFTGYNVKFNVGTPSIKVDKNGKPVLNEKGMPIIEQTTEVIYEPGTVTTKEASIKRAVKKMMGKGVMVGVEYVEEVRGVEVNEFFRISKPITRPASQQKKPAIEKGGEGA